MCTKLYSVLFRVQQFVQMPQMNTEFGERSFSCCSPKIWNEILPTVNAVTALVTYICRLKSDVLIH